MSFVPPTSPLGRRRMLKWSSLTLGLAAVAPILQACGSGATPTTAPATPTAAAKPAAAEPPKPPAAGPPAAAPAAPAAAATKPAAGAASPAAAATTAPAAAGATPAAAGAATATPAPSQSVVQAVAAIQKPKSGAKVNGKLQILQNQD